MNSKIEIYEPNMRFKKSWIKTWIDMVKNTWDSKELIWQLFKRDFFMSYKKSFIGMGWILISPIIGIISWVLMNQTGILTPGDTEIPYPAYVLLSTSIWGLFMGFYGAAKNTLGAGGGFINQVKYPHEALLMKQTLQHIASFMITFIINIIVLLLFGIVPSATIFLFPLAILPLFFLGASMGLVIGIISIVATDISNIFGKLLSFVLYITPVIFAPETENEILQKIIEINPLTYLIGTVRDLIISGNVEHWDRYFIVSAISFVLFLLALRLFYVAEDKAIEKMI